MGTSTRDGSQLSRFEAATAGPMMALALAVAPLYVGQELAAGADPWVTRPLAFARLAIQITMGIDIIARTALAPRRLAFLTNHKLDLLAVIAPPVRAARELVAMRAILRRPGIARFTAVSAMMIIGCTLVVYAAEQNREGASIQSVGDAFWWAMVTTTTVGYGDEVPISAQGRFMAIVLMGLGVAVLAVVTAHIAAYFVDDGREARTDELIDRLVRIEAALNRVASDLNPPIPPQPSTPLPAPRSEELP